jgi:hypothetical protein
MLEIKLIDYIDCRDIIGISREQTNSSLVVSDHFMLYDDVWDTFTNSSDNNTALILELRINPSV